MKKQTKKGTLHATMVRDDLLHHIERAVKSILDPTPTDSKIHSARKKLKRARAHLRLLRDAIGKVRYTRENSTLRDAARPLSGIRDAAVLCETADKLISRVRRGPQCQLLLKVHRELEQARPEVLRQPHVTNALNHSVADLNAAIARMRRWHFKQSDTRSLFAGLQRIYRRGRKALVLVCEDPTNQNFHEWRKQVKYLAYSLAVWKTHGTDVVCADLTRADKLADLLGTHHDLVVFEKRIDNLDAFNVVLPVIGHTLVDQRRELLGKALKKGHRLFKEKPRFFIDRIAP